MRYKPSEEELENADNLTKAERVFYFIQRIAEAEEVWGLASSSGWILSEKEEDSYLPVWPYKEFASKCISGVWSHLDPDAVSLEHFLYKTLPLMEREEISLEVFPIPGGEGELVDARTMIEQLESVVDSNEYYLEG